VLGSSQARQHTPKDFNADGVRHALSEATKERTQEWRATEKSPGSFNARLRRCTYYFAMCAIVTKQTCLMRWRRSAFGSKPNFDQPLFANLDL
jgi:hypothetical protein